MGTPKFLKYEGLENDFQKAIARYLDSCSVLWFHCPNEIKSNAHYGAKRKSQGVKSGVPDVIILEPKQNYCGLFLELKVRYNKPSENQLAWLDKLNNRGFYADWTNSLDEAIYIIDEYLNGTIKPINKPMLKPSVKPTPKPYIQKSNHI